MLDPEEPFFRSRVGDKYILKTTNYKCQRIKDKEEVVKKGKI